VQQPPQSPPQQQQSSPDPSADTRFLLANERTLLAWIRTGVTLVVAGLGVHQFGSKVAAQTVLALLLMLVGATAAGLGGRRYLAADRAIRRNELPMQGRAPLLLVAGVVALAVLLMVAVVVDASS
jgi:putative membrane protein